MANLPTSIKNLNTLLGEQLTEGGGSSDFSTAKVTIVNNVNSHVNFSIPVVSADETLEFANASFSVDPNSTAVTDVILYKGSALCPEVQPVEVPVVHMSVSGDITEGAFGLLTITGDGTITIDE